MYDNEMPKRLYGINEIIGNKRNNVIFYMKILKIVLSAQEEKILSSVIHNERQHIRELEQAYREMTCENIIPLQQKVAEKPVNYIEGLKTAIVVQRKAIMDCNWILTATQDIKLKTIISNILNDELKSLEKFHLLYTENRIKVLYSANQYREMKEFTLEELAQYDGSGGKSAYVAVDGVVYDVSSNSLWGGGTHFGLYAGKDLTAEFNGCHSMKAILEKLIKVGILKK